MSEFFFQYFGTGAGVLKIGKISDKTRIWGHSHFNKPFRLEVCLRYLNNYNNKWMTVLSIGEIKYMITLHNRNILQFFLRNFGCGKFFRQFWENLEKNRIGTGAEFRPQIGSKKNHCMCLLIKTVFSGERCGPWASRYVYMEILHL